ncbi:hypothetical protein [Lysinibacillus sp. 54212]|uniref:hypothetical protein n=1 Tax=Lysinibacillus sp. 54212 TaxID=3119829 RepID=UPI002FC9C3B4
MVVNLVSNQEIIKGLAYLTHTGRFHECLRHGTFVLSRIQESNDVEDEVKVLAELVEACLQLSDSVKLKIYFLQYEEKIKFTKLQQSQLRFLILKGHVQLAILNDEEAAMHSYKKAASLAFKIQDYGRLTVILTNIIYLHKDTLPLDQLLKLAQLNYLFAHQATDRKAIRIISCTLKLLDIYVKLMDCEKFYHFYHLVKSMPELQNQYREKIMVEIVYANGLICEKKYEEALHVLHSLEEELIDSSDFLLLLDVLNKFQDIYSVYQTEKLDEVNKKIAFNKELQKKRAEEFGPIFQQREIQRWKLQQQTIHEYTNGLIQSTVPFCYTLFHVAQSDYDQLAQLIDEKWMNMHYKSMKVHEEKLLLITHQREEPVALISNLRDEIRSLEYATLQSTQASSSREFFDLAHAILYYKQFKRNHSDM